MFSCEFCEISKNTFSHRTPPVDASLYLKSASPPTEFLKEIKKKQIVGHIVWLKLQAFPKETMFIAFLLFFQYKFFEISKFWVTTRIKHFGAARPEPHCYWNFLLGSLPILLLNSFYQSRTRGVLRTLPNIYEECFTKTMNGLSR